MNAGPGPDPGADLGGVAALVDGQPVTTAEVAAEVARLRAGPLADRLPPDGSPAGRQLRRWTTQRLVLRHLLEQEAVARHLPPPGPQPEPAPPEAGQPAAGQPEPARPEPRQAEPAQAGPGQAGPGQAGPGQAGWADPAVLGSAAADVLASSPAARAVFAALTAGVTVPAGVVRAHYDANMDRYTLPARWLIRLATVAGSTVDPAASTVAGSVAVPVDPATLPAPLREALAAAPVGQRVGPVRGPQGWQVAVREEAWPARLRPYAEVRDQIAGTLLHRRRQQAFARWLDARAGQLVMLHPGYEHPADPHNPDATHRH
ncbi:MAG TPA: peptidylprolyl isomerase [Mycobacteriales bacterium]|nr:peptidylprolyl isomerase [Mycobacteriales bacterium]